jgi:hypothetical protein
MRSFPNYVDEYICFFNNKATDRLRDEDYYIDGPLYSKEVDHATVFFCESCFYHYKGNDVEYIVLDEMVEKENGTQ